MDSRSADAKICNVVDKPPVSIDFKVGGGKKGEEDYGETKSLLPPAVNGRMTGKRQKSSRRKVQWNDRNGNKLVEVLEFQPSDSSDSEDEYADSCICVIM